MMVAPQKVEEKGPFFRSSLAMKGISSASFTICPLEISRFSPIFSSHRAVPTSKKKYNISNINMFFHANIKFVLLKILELRRKQFANLFPQPEDENAS